MVTKIEEKVKAMKSEIKENVQELSMMGRSQDSNAWFGPKGKNKHSTTTE